MLIGSWKWAQFLCVAIFLATPRAFALPSSRLVYIRGDGAETCPEPMELRLAVIHRLGYNPFEPNAKNTIVLILRQNGEVIQGTMELTDEQGLSRGTRELTVPADSCDQLLAAAALSISLAIDPDRALHAQLPNQSPDGKQPSTAFEPTPNALIQTTPVGASVRTWGVIRPRNPRELTLSLHESVLVLAAPTVGFGVGYTTWRGAASFSVEGNVELPASRNLRENAKISTTLFSASLIPCWRGQSLRVCAIGSLGDLRATSSGIVRPKSDAAWYAALGLRIGSVARVSRRWQLGVHVDLLSPLFKYEIRVDENVVWRSNPLAGRIGFSGAWDIQ